jgi:hypothetical protein
MTSLPPQGPVVKVKPQPDLYTLLLILAILILAVTIGVVLYDLMANYGMTLGEILTGKTKGLPPV